MKINKNSTLAFIGGLMLASSASMFAASTTTVNNNSTNNKNGSTETRHSRGHRANRAGKNASSTMSMGDKGMGMEYGGMMNYGGAMKNFTDAEKQVIKDKMNSNLAQILGISKETLLAKIVASTTMLQMIKGAGLTEEQFHSKMDTLRKADMEKVLADQVASGKITQAKADGIKAKMAERGIEKKTHNASSTKMFGSKMMWH